MAITKSAKKAHRQNLKRKKRNIGRKDKIKKLTKKARVLIGENKKEEAKKIFPQLQKALDKAVKRGVIKKNTASRKKSRLSKILSSKKKN